MSIEFNLVDAYIHEIALEIIRFNIWQKENSDVEEFVDYKISELLKKRKYSQKIITDCVSNFSNKLYSEDKFSKKITFLTDYIERFEFNSIQESNSIPNYFKNDLITVGSGLYLIFIENQGVFCDECYFIPNFGNEGKLKTLISSDSHIKNMVLSRISERVEKYIKGNI